MISFRHATVLACTGADPGYDATVIVEGAVIKEVLTGARSAAQAGGEAIDCGGRTVMPGLIDAHVHVCAIEVDLAAQRREYPTSLLAYAAGKMISEALDQGFTTVRDAGGADWADLLVVDRDPLADQGTSFYGAATHRLPRDVTFIGQPLWASIGYTLPALLGACLATSQRRGILLIGDGAAQTTIQELSTALHSGISAVVIVVDNDGYTVERAIHGPTQPCNDIPRWDWTSAPALFGADCDWTAVRVTTVGELDQALAAASARKLTLIQAVVPPMDVPELLEMIAKAAGQANAQQPS
jgi:alpha-keto-acid decarboxylase